MAKIEYNFEIERLEIKGVVYFKVSNWLVDMPIMMAEKAELITELEIYQYAIKKLIKQIKENYDYDSCIKI